MAPSSVSIAIAITEQRVISDHQMITGVSTVRHGPSVDDPRNPCHVASQVFGSGLLVARAGGARECLCAPEAIHSQLHLTLKSLYVL